MKRLGISDPNAGGIEVDDSDEDDEEESMSMYEEEEIDEEEEDMIIDPAMSFEEDIEDL